ncbi:MAG: DsrE family protein [Spirochaetales bacterium]
MKEKLVVLWTTKDPDTAKYMVLMYTLNAKRRGWFDDVTLVIWGSSSRLVAEDQEIQAKVKELLSEGITVEACLRCADALGASDRLRELGVDVKLMGEPMSQYLKEGRRVLSV